MNNKKFDAIVVLGYELKKNFELKNIAKYRVERANELFEKGLASKVIFLGSHSFWNKDKPEITEAKAMRDYAISKGLPKNVTLLEENSKDSIGNAYFVRKNYLEKNNWKKIIVVTTDFHIPKTKYVFQKVLGNNYYFKTESTKSGLSASKVKELKLRERKVVDWFKKYFENTRDGDLEMIEKYLYTHHPGYAKTPEVTIEEIRKKFKPIDVD